MADIAFSNNGDTWHVYICAGCADPVVPQAMWPRAMNVAYTVCSFCGTMGNVDYYLKKDERRRKRDERRAFPLPRTQDTDNCELCYGDSGEWVNDVWMPCECIS